MHEPSKELQDNFNYNSLSPEEMVKGLVFLVDIGLRQHNVSVDFSALVSHATPTYSTDCAGREKFKGELHCLSYSKHSNCEMKKKLIIPTYIFSLIWTRIEMNIVSGSSAFLF